jgi:hypothetical protein
MIFSDVAPGSKLLMFSAIVPALNIGRCGS